MDDEFGGGDSGFTETESGQQSFLENPSDNEIADSNDAANDAVPKEPSGAESGGGQLPGQTSMFDETGSNEIPEETTEGSGGDAPLENAETSDESSNKIPEDNGEANTGDVPSDVPKNKNEIPEEGEKPVKEGQEGIKESENTIPEEEEQPKTEEKQPKTEEEQPKTEEEQPKTEEEQPKTEEEQPKTEEEQPKTEEEQSKAEEEQPKTEKEQPKAEEEQPKAEEEQPKAEEEQPKQEKSEEPQSDFEKINHPNMTLKDVQQRQGIDENGHTTGEGTGNEAFKESLPEDYKPSEEMTDADKQNFVEAQDKFEAEVMNDNTNAENIPENENIEKLEEKQEDSETPSDESKDNVAYSALDDTKFSDNDLIKFHGEKPASFTNEDGSPRSVDFCTTYGDAKAQGCFDENGQIKPERVQDVYGLNPEWNDATHYSKAPYNENDYNFSHSKVESVIGTEENGQRVMKFGGGEQVIAENKENPIDMNASEERKLKPLPNYEAKPELVEDIDAAHESAIVENERWDNYKNSSPNGEMTEDARKQFYVISNSGHIHKKGIN